jgi:hypothetical protein
MLDYLAAQHHVEHGSEAGRFIQAPYVQNAELRADGAASPRTSARLLNVARHIGDPNGLKTQQRRVYGHRASAAPYVKEPSTAERTDSPADP